MTKDNQKKMTVEYNHLNLPRKITFEAGTWIEWTYDASGQKLRKKTSNNKTTNYVNGIEYTGTNGTVIEAIYHPEGRSTPQYDAEGAFLGYRYEYSLRDHLGNTRVTFADKNGSNSVDPSEILQQNHYYPFGLNQEGTWNSGPNKYQYNGKELNTDFGLEWNDYGKRFYDAAAGRWWSVDELAGLAHCCSPYGYVLGNPISNIDPDGLWTKTDEGNWHTSDPNEIQDFIDAYSALMGNYYVKDGDGTDDEAFRMIGIGQSGEHEAHILSQRNIDSDAEERFQQAMAYFKTCPSSEISPWGVTGGAALESVNDPFTLMMGSASKGVAEYLISAAARAMAQKTVAETGITFAEEFVSVFHKGILRNGIVSGSRTLSTGTERDAVAALARQGPVWEFRIPKSVLQNWLNKGWARELKDLDSATGIINQEIRFTGHLAEELNKYIIIK